MWSNMNKLTTYAKYTPLLQGGYKKSDLNMWNLWQALLGHHCDIRIIFYYVVLTLHIGIFQTMAASKRNAGVPSALSARQSLNDEELVRKYYIWCLFKYYKFRKWLTREYTIFQNQTLRSITLHMNCISQY